MRLTADERNALKGLVPSFASPSTVTGVCAYGSKVAGYARPDSDYDLVVVVRRFREGVRYRYLDKPVPASALIVDEGLLSQDARSSSLGEFVVGRFLNVYEPISNPELFRSVELEYKRRVVMESLLELSSDYGDFCRHLLVPYEYFLFEKLKKRSSIYPPALYSYVQTYGSAMGRENLSRSVSGFKEAAAQLASRGYFSAEAGGVRMVPERMKGDAFTKVQSLFALTTRGVTQYAVHGYAGRVGLSVFRKEAQSKLRRMREKFEPLAELEHPKALLKLEEGVVIPDASRLEKEIAHQLGYAEFTSSERLIGDPYSTTRILSFSGSGRQSSVVLKNFSDVRSLKWALLGIWAAAANRFSMSPLARLDREYAMTLALRGADVLVPRIIAVSPDVRILVKEYIEGPTLARVIDGYFRAARPKPALDPVTHYGELLSTMHGAGFALGDAKSSNVVVSDRGLYLTDLEQSSVEGDKAWDLAEFIYYTAKLSTKEDEMEAIARAFLLGYSKDGVREVIEKASSLKYLRPFQPFILPGMTKSLRELMGEYY